MDRSLLLIFYSFRFPLIFLSSFLEMKLLTMLIRSSNIFQCVFAIASISFIIFFTFQKLKSIKFLGSSLINFLLAFLLGSTLFSIFAWFYFPHRSEIYNEAGYQACVHFRASGQGNIADFIRDNGNATAVSEEDSFRYYSYRSDYHHFCDLKVDSSGTIVGGRLGTAD